MVGESGVGAASRDARGSGSGSCACEPCQEATTSGSDATESSSGVLGG